MTLDDAVTWTRQLRALRRVYRVLTHVKFLASEREAVDAAFTDRVRLLEYALSQEPAALRAQADAIIDRDLLTLDPAETAAAPAGPIVDGVPRSRTIH